MEQADVSESRALQSLRDNEFDNDAAINFILEEKLIQ